MKRTQSMYAGKKLLPWWVLAKNLCICLVLGSIGCSLFRGAHAIVVDQFAGVAFVAIASTNSS